MTWTLTDMGVNISVRSKNKTSTRPSQIPTDGAKPFDTISYIPDDGVLLNGFPYTPEIWVETQTSASTDGTFFDGDRPDQYSIPQVGGVRFVASDPNYDEISGIWTPYYSDQIDYYFVTPVNNQPLLEDVTYVVGKELFDRFAFRLYPGSRMDSSFNSNLDQATNVGIAMVMLMNQTTGYPVMTLRDSSQIYGEIYYDGTFQLTVFDGAVLRTYPLKVAAPTVAPTYVFYEYTPAGITLTAGSSVSSLQSINIPLAMPVTAPFQVMLGSDNLIGSSGDFHLLDFVVYDPGDRLSVSAALGSTYGGR